jgi:Mor family transcriptional regulator
VKTIREIAKEYHMSFSDIGGVIKQEFGSEKLELSRDAQVLKLFVKGTKPIEIAIKFNISADEVQRLHREYRGLS